MELGNFVAAAKALELRLLQAVWPTLDGIESRDIATLLIVIGFGYAVGRRIFPRA